MSWFAPDVLIGGFHFMKVDPTGAEHTVLDEAAQVLSQADTQYYTCHCTGLAQYEYLKARMLIMGIGAVLNIALDPLLIALTHSVDGAAYATVIAQVVQAAITLWYFINKSKTVRIHRLMLDGRILPQVLGVGVSAMLMQVMMMVQQTIMYNVAAQFGGNEWQILLGASLRIQAFAFIPLWGLSQGFQPAAGTNYGAEKFTRVRQMLTVFLLGGTVLALLFYLPVMPS